MNYYKNSATPERLKWWQELPTDEQYLRTQLYRLEKWDKTKEKKLLRYPENAYPETQRFLKNNIRLLKKAIKAIKRRLPVPGHWRRTEANAVAWCCGICNTPIPNDSEYCPYCGQKVDGCYPGSGQQHAQPRHAHFRRNGQPQQHPSRKPP